MFDISKAKSHHNKKAAKSQPDLIQLISYNCRRKDNLCCLPTSCLLAYMVLVNAKRSATLNNLRKKEKKTLNTYRYNLS